MARGRGVASPKDKEAMRLISKKIKTLLKQKQIKQIELSRGTGIPASTLTGYIKGNYKNNCSRNDKKKVKPSHNFSKNLYCFDFTNFSQKSKKKV